MSSLREAVATIHRDPRWWQKIAVGGALMLPVFGYPLAAGMVMLSMENSRKGFPTPLPPWFDWSTRYLIGLFALLIDFVFFVLPVFVAGMLFVCVGMVGLISGNTGEPLTNVLFRTVGIGTGLFIVSMFLSSVSPVARLIFAEQGNIEDALSVKPLRRALGSQARAAFFRARLASLVAYLPAVLLAALLVFLTQMRFPGQIFALLVAAWLSLSAVLYAHLVIVQLYVSAEQEVRERAV